jgi:uncharacterized membrane protein
MQAYVLLTILASIFYGISVVLQKKGIEKISKTKNIFQNIKHLIKKILNKYFLTGIAIGFFGTVSYWKAMSIGEISIIQPLINISTIVTWVFGIFYLKEKVYPKEWIGLILIFVGALVLSVSA